MSRLIDADALREQLQNLAYDDWNQGVSTSWADAYREIADMVDDAPTIEPEQRWIPCSERLPDAQTEVIVSCIDDSGDTRFLYTSSGWVTTNGEYWIVDNEINSFVIAWMPLPPSYKGDKT